jgi:pimeloyl-ACP methyl ester carboxylesterase
VAPLTRRDALFWLAAGTAAGVRADVAHAQGGIRAGTRVKYLPPPRANALMSIGGVNVYYEEQGQGIPILLNPGGQSAAEETRGVAAQLAKKYRVISWDRPNTPGRSEVAFKGSREVDLWADQLDELLGRLDARPAYLVGPSMGVRLNVATAVRYPDLVRGLFSFFASGQWNFPGLPKSYWGNYADVADKGGMQAVVRTPRWAEVIRRNPQNRERLLSIDPKEFARVMRRWTDAHKPSDVALLITEADLRRHSANGIATRIIVGCDDAHDRQTSERMAALMPNAELVDPPGFCEDWAKRKQAAIDWAEQHEEQRQQPYYEMPAIPALIEEFITKTEATSTVRGAK